MKKQVIAASLVLAIGLFSAGAVLAAAGTNPYSVSVGDNGNIKLAGTILSVSGATWNVVSWGGTWSVGVGSAQVINNGGTTTTVAGFASGDAVIVTGTAATSSLTVNAATVQEQNDNANAGGQVGFFGKLWNGMRSFFGTVSNLNVGGNTFTLTGKNGNAAQVNVNASTTILVKNGTSTAATTTIAGLANGMFAGVSGSATGTPSSTVITATKVRAGTQPVNLKAHGFFGIGGGLKGFGHGKGDK